MTVKLKLANDYSFCSYDLRQFSELLIKDYDTVDELLKELTYPNMPVVVIVHYEQVGDDFVLTVDHPYEY